MPYSQLNMSNVSLNTLQKMLFLLRFFCLVKFLNHEGFYRQVGTIVLFSKKQVKIKRVFA